jgi:hypothetical protein
VRFQNVVQRGYSNGFKKQAARRAGACDWGPRYYMFRVRFCRRGGFRPNSCDFFESKNQQRVFHQTLLRWGGHVAPMARRRRAALHKFVDGYSLAPPALPKFWKKNRCLLFDSKKSQELGRKPPRRQNRTRNI